MHKVNDYDVVADLYDIYVPVTFDINFFVNETVKTSGEVLELMSGSGRVSIPLLHAGVKLTCVDASEKLNSIFKQKLKEHGLQADIYQMDVRKLNLPKLFSMVIIPFNSFAHLLTLDDQRKALRLINRHLLPGGTFICSLGNPTIRRRDIDGHLHLANSYPVPKGKLLWWMLEEFDPEDKTVVNAFEIYEEYDASGILTSKRMMELHFRLTPKDEFEELLKSTGFSVKNLYGDYEYHAFEPETSPYMVWVLEKVVNT